MYGSHSEPCLEVNSIMAVLAIEAKEEALGLTLICMAIMFRRDVEYATDDDVA